MNNIKLNLGLQTKLAQKIIITPQMKQSISILQMPITELAQEISSYVEDNPILEIFDHETELPEQDSNAKEIEESLMEDIKSPEWDDYIDNGSSNELIFTPLNPDDEQNNYEHYVSSDISIIEHLLFQLNTSSLTDSQKKAGKEIIGNLDDDGYFRYGVENIVKDCGIELCDCKTALETIKTFDPAGIASENLAECIITQLPEVGASPGEILQIKEILCGCGKELEGYKYKDIEKKCKIDSNNLDELLGLIRKTDPRPGAHFSNRGNQYIFPDVYIVRDEDNFDVLVNESGLPSLKLNEHYLKALRNMKDDDVAKPYIEEKLKNAIWILKSLQKRQKAIYVVAKAIVDFQRDFLLKGEAYLRPLKLKDIAEIADFSESTVSRVTSGKYAMTEHGLIELKSFFSKGMDSQDGDVSTRRIKTFIKGFIDSEPADAPYSDEKIVKLLSDEGVDIARRTVAKYRDEMGVPTMSKRKRMRR